MGGKSNRYAASPKQYRIQLAFTTDASQAERQAVFEEIDHSLSIRNRDTAEQQLAKASGPLEVVVETASDINSITDALVGVSHVKEVTADEMTPAASDEPMATPLASTATTSQATFQALQEETDPLELHELMNDEEYIEFLDNHPEVTSPEDNTSVIELLKPDGGTAAALPDEAAASEPETESNPDKRADTTTEGGSVTATLLRELEEDRVSPAQQRRLRDALGAEPSSLETRVTYLQSRFHELAAYIDAMEEFLDEHGSGSDVLTDVQTSLEALHDDIQELRETQTMQAAQITELRDEIERLAADYESLDEDVATNVATLEDSLATLEAQHDTLQEDVHDVLTWRAQLSDLFTES